MSETGTTRAAYKRLSVWDLEEIYGLHISPQVLADRIGCEVSTVNKLRLKLRRAMKLHPSQHAVMR